MASPQKTILGISPGNRAIGIAVIVGEELYDWSIKTFDGAVTSGKLIRIKKTIEQIIDEYGADIIACKITDSSVTSRFIKKLVAVFRDLSVERGIEFLESTLQELKATCINVAKPTKGHLIEFIVGIYPVLFGECVREKRNRNQYYTRMFEAVAAAHVCIGR